MKRTWKPKQKFVFIRKKVNSWLVWSKQNVYIGSINIHTDWCINRFIPHTEFCFYIIWNISWHSCRLYLNLHNTDFPIIRKSITFLSDRQIHRRHLSNYSSSFNYNSFITQTKTLSSPWQHVHIWVTIEFRQFHGPLILTHFISDYLKV